MQSHFLRAFLLIALIFVGSWSGLAPLMDSWWGIFPLALVFIAFVAGLMGWGFFWERRIGGGIAVAALLSSFTAVAFAMVMGHLGFLGANHRWYFLALLAVGLFLDPKRAWGKEFLLFKNYWWAGIFVFVFGLRFLSAYLPHAHGDPLLYHLMAPRLWNLMGSVRLNTDLPIPLLASTWEYFFLWPQILFANGKVAVESLVLAQIFSQWIHLAWGLGGSLLVLKALLEKSVKLSENHLAILLLSFLFVSSMQWTAGLAKNDCGVAFWSLGAWFFLGDRTKRSWFFAGIFTGLAVAGKINAILFLIPVGILITYQEVQRKKWKNSFALLGFALLGMMLGALPIYLRNWLETSNPFYTMFYRWFPSYWVSESWSRHFSAHQPSDNHIFEMLVYRARELAKESPAYWLWIFSPIVLFVKQVRSKVLALKDWYIVFFLSVGICVVALSTAAEVRYLGAALWLGAMLAVYLFLAATEILTLRWKNGVVLFLTVGLLAASKLPTHLLWKLPKIHPGTEMVLEHTAGKAKEWLRNNAGEHLVVINGDNETYYLSNIRTTVLTERPDIDAATLGKKDFAEFLEGLCKTSGGTYLLDARLNAALPPRFPSPAWSQAVVFEADNAHVYDLQKLQALVLKRDAGCGQDFNAFSF